MPTSAGMGCKDQGGSVKQFSLIGHYFAQTFESPGAWFGAVIGVFLSALTPSPQVAACAIGLFVLWVLDALMAVAHAIKEGRAITKQRFIDGSFKLAAYAVILISVGIMRLAEPRADMLWQLLMTICLSMFMATELLSIAGHAEAFGVRLPKKLLRALKGIQKDADKGTLEKGA